MYGSTATEELPNVNDWTKVGSMLLMTMSGEERVFLR
jgi:hypothetical protein